MLSNSSEIFQLPGDVSNKIAAGEVVERPINVVKELVENAVDASSEKITVEIAEGGLSLIKVQDDGRGIVPDDIEKSIDRFATSKITDINDVYELYSFGFRGEALAAISSVCDFSLVSKRKGYDCLELKSSFGGQPVVKPAAGTEGTVVTVKNLFGNLPARRKFLKSPNAEQREIVKFIRHFMLTNYHLSLRLIVDEKEYLFFPRNDSMIDRAAKVFKEQKLVYLTNKYENLHIEAVISTPEVQKFRRDNIVLSVNGRVIKDNMLTQSVIQAYKRLIPEGKFPLAAIRLNISPGDMDINVHPAKLFVKFLNSGEIFSFVYGSILEKLESLTPGGYDSDNYTNLNETAETKIKSFQNSYNPEEQVSVSDFLTAVDTSVSSDESDNMEEVYGYDFRIAGQLFNTVIICEFDDFFYMIDQHIAHERILYEKYKAESSVDTASVVLSEPLVIDLEEEEREILISNKKILCDFGFDFESFGGGTVKFSKLPSEILNKDVVSEIKNILEETSRLSKKGLKDSSLVVMSCKSAIKAGEKLSRYEMSHLVNKLLKTKNPFTCPHGRPIIVTQSKEELFKNFHR
ncbi:MAG: DNA mismatch repair endonuclease MutL [Flexistipes sinusarabici]|uniref:DNA mismatch repair protein MutL n=1 Tax=Flexistipes sinusarabici TaxID=2352 RepID=A0A5D0MRG5_FLESI|nr:DNA mismatch repair endonuclease MutL [Flexistipes sinusarabici]TYB33489.1 MAG: DNA mismatch repair endonuclease MutL [Flexistipes sinusarabici]